MVFHFKMKNHFSAKTGKWFDIYNDITRHHFPSPALTRSGSKGPEVQLQSQLVSQAPLVLQLSFNLIHIIARI